MNKWMELFNSYQMEILFFFDSISHKTIDTVIAFVGVIASIILLLIILKQNKTIEKQNKVLENQNNHLIKESKITKSLFFINEYNSSEFQKNVITVLSDKLDEIKKSRFIPEEESDVVNPNHFGLKEIDELIESDKNFYQAFIRLSSFFQELANLYNNKLLDQDLIKSSLARYSSQWFFKIKEKIEDKRLSETDITDWEIMNESFMGYLVLDITKRSQGKYVNYSE